MAFRGLFNVDIKKCAKQNVFICIDFFNVHSIFKEVPQTEPILACHGNILSGMFLNVLGTPLWHLHDYCFIIFPFWFKKLLKPIK